jgi:hypothetical protein
LVALLITHHFIATVRCFSDRSVPVPSFTPLDQAICCGVWYLEVCLQLQRSHQFTPDHFAINIIGAITNVIIVIIIDNIIVFVLITTLVAFEITL